MLRETRVADHWGKDDVYGLILSTLQNAGKPAQGLTVEDLAPIDHFHARGLPATVELGDRLSITSDSHLLDIGCGLGGPARYFAKRFGCKVSGIDITPAFVEAANKLTALVGLERQVTIEQGDGEDLPYAEAVFNGAYAQHVTMNVAHRERFFSEAYRVLKVGAFFVLTEHGLGPTDNPYHPVPWSEEGSGAFLVTPDETHRFLEATGFRNIEVEETGPKYLDAYRQILDMVAQGTMPPLGPHVLIGATAAEKLRNAARNIEEGRTTPVQVFCWKE